MSKLLFNNVTGPQGVFDVSTVQTFTGGAPDVKPLGSPFSLSDYADENPWPYEPMVFWPDSSRGLYHRAYRDKKDAKKGHIEIVQACLDGVLPIGDGVRGDFGIPSLTPEEWKAMLVTT